jgi:hypothetical protein
MEAKAMIDSIYIPIIVGILIIIFAVIYNTFVSVSNALYSATNLDLFSNFAVWNNVFTFLIVGVYFGLPIIGIILSYLSGIHPIFLPLGIVMLMIGVFLFAIMKGVIMQIIPSFSEAYTLFSNSQILSKLIEYYPLIMAIFALLIIIFQFLQG